MCCGEVLNCFAPLGKCNTDLFVLVWKRKTKGALRDSFCFLSHLSKADKIHCLLLLLGACSAGDGAMLNHYSFMCVMVGKYSVQVGCSWRKPQQSSELASNPVRWRWENSQVWPGVLWGDIYSSFWDKALPRRGQFKVYSEDDLCSLHWAVAVLQNPGDVYWGQFWLQHEVCVSVSRLGMSI